MRLAPRVHEGVISPLVGEMAGKPEGGERKRAFIKSCFLPTPPPRETHPPPPRTAAWRGAHRSRLF
ncbi:hypothetical protein C5748_08865 [Phyllobacterium phragmitis]|uniref:Propionyl-coenzyme A carboxylase alpha polypeptide n=1 Tax=Phyllobacterium phragmitis TaxID=2670329 RepID=A0A2S9ITU6_9HYPH|nr:hypothetical protein C5748_08865 [Phyllobacterium phragmitis]